MSKRDAFWLRATRILALVPILFIISGAFLWPIFLPLLDFGFWMEHSEWDSLDHSQQELVLDGLVEHYQPLVDAIHAFEEDRGVPPAELEDLVPEYLGRLPELTPEHVKHFMYHPRIEDDSLFLDPPGSPESGRPTSESWMLRLGLGEYEHFDDWLDGFVYHSRGFMHTRADGTFGNWSFLDVDVNAHPIPR